MNRLGQISRLSGGILMLASVSIALAGCGGGGIDLAGGGTGGTGISTGSVTGFGSVVVNGVHFLTDDDVAPGFVTKKTFMGMDNSTWMDRDLFRVGMVVTVRHAQIDNNAQEIEYRDNLKGRISAKNSGADNTFAVLGQTVVVDNAALFDSLLPNDVAEVSGYVDAAGRIRATYIAMVPCSMMPMCPVSEFEVAGYISGLSSPDASFRLGPLPDGTGTTVTVSYAPAMGAGLDNGMYVQVVTTDPEPVSGGITATRIDRLVPRTVFPENAAADLEGLVTASPSGSGNVLSFAVEGKRIQTDGDTQFAGGTAADIQPNVRLQVQGTENGGVLSAARIVFR